LRVLLHPGFEPFAPHQLAPTQDEVSQFRKAVNPTQIVTSQLPRRVHLPRVEHAFRIVRSM
jgi:hypothetical protein